MILGISANTVFAEDATTEASSVNDPGDDLIGLRKIEDGSVVSNIHTAKWRVFTDKARDFFLQASNFFPLHSSHFNFLSSAISISCPFSSREN